MAKYRGKYDKCRTCEYAIEVMMILVEVKKECPNGIQFSSAVMTDKQTCQQCEDWREKK